MLFLMVLSLSFFVLVTSNVFFWWGVFLFMTIFFIFLNKKEGSHSSILNYFVLQESLGLLFLLLFFGGFPAVILMLKIGVAPFHFWVFKVISGVKGLNLVWFLTIHKLPFLLVFLQLFFFNLVFLLFVGLFMCLTQLFMLKSLKNLLVISSIESFNWVTMGLVMSFFNVFLLFFYYAIMMIFMVYSFDLYTGLSFSNSWELTLAFMNLPFSFGFFVKIFLLMEFLSSLGMFMVLVMFLMFMSVLSFSFWMVYLGTKSCFFSKYNNCFFMFFFPMMMVVLVYPFSKMLLCYLDEVKF